MDRYTDIFTANIKKTFGNKGQEWLNKLEKTVQHAVDKWQLECCRAVDNLSFNYVCTAESPFFGPVILKIGVLKNEVFQEYSALNILNKDITCSCYDYDRANNALLLQRIVPGENLFSLKNPDEQIQAGCRLLKEMTSKPVSLKGFPHYRELISKAYSSAREIIPAFAEEAAGYFEDIDKLNRPDRILHGDFHHQNILKDETGKWLLIDPKGVVGKQPMECGRFIMNQLTVLDKKDHLFYLKTMIASFARSLYVKPEVIFKCAYTEFVLSCCWTLEGDLQKSEVEKVLSDLQYTTDLYKQYGLK